MTQSNLLDFVNDPETFAEQIIRLNKEIRLAMIEHMKEQS